MDSWKEVEISVNLTNRVAQYLDFLQSYSSSSRWRDNTVLRRAIYRYESLWLPLAAAWSSTDLEPPLDVRWIWHLHLLRPRHYHNYCLDKFGRVVYHKLRKSSAEEKYAKERTALIWKDKYQSEPYELEARLSGDRFTQTNSRLWDLLFNSLDQKDYLYQVSLSHYRDEVFLAQAYERYKKFLHLWTLYGRNLSIDVPHDIQLLWRIHALHPAEYYTDLERLRSGQELVLDIHDLMSGYNARGNDNQWRTLYKEPLKRRGTGFRGYLVDDIEKVPPQYIAQQKVETCDLVINDLTVSDIWSGEKTFLIEAKRLGDSSFSYTSIFITEGKANQILSSPDKDRGLGAITFDSRYHRGLEFHIFGRKGKFCFKKEHHIATVFYNPREAFTEGSFHSRTLHVDIPKVTVTDPSLKFTANIRAAEQEATVLSMHRDPFEMKDLPEGLRAYTEQQALWDSQHSPEGDYPFIVARHGLKSRTNKVGFGVQVVKCDPADLGAVQLYLNNDRLVAVAYSIGPEHLPSAKQVSGSHPVTMEAGDRAMLIQNAAGDWAVCVGRWVPDAAGSPGEGKVVFSVYDVTSGTCSVHEVRDDEMQTLELGDVTVDMPTGKISLGAGCRTIAESVTLGFCAGILFLVCQKHAIQGPSGSLRGLQDAEALDVPRAASRFNPKVKVSKKRTRRRKMSASFTFLLACGLQMDSYYYSSAPPSKNSTISLNDVPTVTNQAGDVQFVGNLDSSYNRKSYDVNPARHHNSGNRKAKPAHAQLDLSKSGFGASLKSFGENGRAPNGFSHQMESNGHAQNGRTSSTRVNKWDDQFGVNDYMDIRL